MPVDRQIWSSDIAKTSSRNGSDPACHALKLNGSCQPEAAVSGISFAAVAASGELRMLSVNASGLPGRWRLRRAVDTAMTGAPIATAMARASQEKGRTKCDQQERADQVKHPDGDESEVPGDAERTNDDECDRENSHDLLQAKVSGWV